MVAISYIEKKQEVNTMNNVFNSVRRPIMQAPIASAGSPELALAVANAGGIGSLAMTWEEPDSAQATVEYMNANTSGVYAVNFALAFEPQALVSVLEAGVPLVTFSWGMPDELVNLVKEYDTALGVQIGSLPAAINAVERGADFLICQGLEAGGHVQSTVPLYELLTSVLSKIDLPVVAAGGIATADDVAKVLRMGASIAALGTRFVNADESRAHPDYQQAIIDAGAESTAYTCCFDGGWPLTNSRVLRNHTLTNWEAEGCPGHGKRPGENEIVAWSESSGEITRYSIASPVNTTCGDVLDLALYAGTSSAKITDIQPAAEIVKNLCGKLANSY